ncbi:MAG TPA: cell division protein ZapA [Myxococcota bacterium]|nr:cell division protein ZapA [Myxococcota bacterium]
MKPAPKKTVQVKIQGRAYKIRADGEANAASVNRAAAMLDETIERVRIRAGTVDSVDVAVLAALNVANSLVLERETRSAPAVSDARVAALIELIESALASGGAGAS